MNHQDPRISADRASRRVRVLLVEDDPRVRNATRMWLKTKVMKCCPLALAGHSELNDRDRTGIR